MKKIMFLAILLSTIFEAQAVIIKLPSAEVLVHRLLSTENLKNKLSDNEKLIRYYFAKKTNIANKLAHRKLEIREVINITIQTTKKIKDPLMQKQAWKKMDTILKILVWDYEGIEEIFTIKAEMSRQLELQRKTKLSQQKCSCNLV